MRAVCSSVPLPLPPTSPADDGLFVGCFRDDVFLLVRRDTARLGFHAILDSEMHGILHNFITSIVSSFPLLPSPSPPPR